MTPNQLSTVWTAVIVLSNVTVALLTYGLYAAPVPQLIAVILAPAGMDVPEIESPTEKSPLFAYTCTDVFDGNWPLRVPRAS